MSVPDSDYPSLWTGSAGVVFVAKILFLHGWKPSTCVVNRFFYGGFRRTRSSRRSRAGSSWWPLGTRRGRRGTDGSVGLSGPVAADASKQLGRFDRGRSLGLSGHIDSMVSQDECRRRGNSLRPDGHGPRDCSASTRLLRDHVDIGDNRLSAGFRYTALIELGTKSLATRESTRLSRGEIVRRAGTPMFRRRHNRFLVGIVNWVYDLQRQVYAAITAGPRGHRDHEFRGRRTAVRYSKTDFGRQGIPPERFFG